MSALNCKTIVKTLIYLVMQPIDFYDGSGMWRLKSRLRHNALFFMNSTKRATRFHLLPAGLSILAEDGLIG
jgi:hypothetical protein